MKIVVSIKDLSWIEEMKELAHVIVLSDKFHGTQSAHCFSLDEIKAGIVLAQERKLLSAVLMNRMYVDKELEQATDYMKEICECGVDWIYYQDPAIYMIAQQLGYLDKLVYDPDTLLTNYRDVAWIMKQGINHSVLSKEITLDEMLAILKEVDGPSEVIGFGYLKLSTSKRKLVQSYCDEIQIENTLYNKRDGYIVESTREGKMPIIEDEHGTHVFSDHILCALEESFQLSQAKLAYLRVDSIFLEKEMIMDILQALRAIECGEDSVEVAAVFQKKYDDMPLGTGYMHQKTNLVK
ncbi:MAG: peptidase U32 family protein [Anaerorhabdus sp.]